MTLYRYKAIRQGGIMEKGVLEATSHTHLKTSLGLQGLSLITYSSCAFRQKRKVPHRLLRELCVHLEKFERAGLPLRESLEALSLEEKSPHLKEILFQIRHDFEGGAKLSETLSKHPLIFDKVFIGLIEMGERTGNFSEVFQEISNHLKWVDELQAQIFKALRYPLIMAGVLGGVFFILTTILVPELSHFVVTFSEDLPWSTFLLVKFSDSFLWIFTFGITAGLCFLFADRIHPRGILLKASLLETLPLIGRLKKTLALVRFCHVFGILFQRGIDILQSLQTARQSLGPGPLSKAVERIENALQEGTPLSIAFQQEGIFPELVIKMIKLGEKTGTLSQTLLYAKEHLDASLKRQVDHIVGILEPTLILSGGLMMVWIIVSIFLPLYETFSSLDL